MALERAVDFKKPVVDRQPVRGADHLDHAEPLVDVVEQLLTAGLAVAQPGVGLVTIGDVEVPHDRTGSRTLRQRMHLHPEPA